MQPQPNKDLRKFPSEKGKGIAGAALIHIVLFAVLFFASFSIPAPPEIEEGILVNFGTDETGLGLIEPSQAAVEESTSVPIPASAADQQPEEALLTQNDEEAPEVKKVDPEAEKKKLEKIEADRIRKAELEAERKQKEIEEAERKRIEAEQQRQADIVNRTRNALANARNSGTNSTGEGVTEGSGNQGVQTGDVNAKLHAPGGGTGDNGISYSLGGRGTRGELPIPTYKSQKEGKVVVDIWVDRSGNVIRAEPGKPGTSELDDYLLSVAKEAALKTKFEVKQDAAEFQKGTITYIFKLK